MSIDSVKQCIVSHKGRIVSAALVAVAFVAGWLIPSPLVHREPSEDSMAMTEAALKDTVNMVMPDGSVYEGSLDARTDAFEGYGILTKGNSRYEGTWREGKLTFGKRTTPQSVYEGSFNADLDNNGFGIITYTQEYIDGKRNQGLSDNEIVSKYIGNWRNNLKDGIGRAVMVDSSMAFGRYRDGVLDNPEGSDFQVGDRVYGIDVSRHQGDIDWNQLALYCDSEGKVFAAKPTEKKYLQPVFFVYVKATEGATVKDRTFDIRMTEAERHGITKGAYHFLRLGSPVEEQIKNFTETANWSEGDLPPALDVEVESEIQAHGVARLLDMTYTWLEEVEQKMNVRPIIYTRESIRDKYLAKDPRFAKYQCWIARYHPDGPVKEEWTFWQMTERGRLKGYKGDVDIDIFKGTYRDFETYLRSIATKSPAK